MTPSEDLAVNDAPATTNTSNTTIEESSLPQRRSEVAASTCSDSSNVLRSKRPADDAAPGIPETETTTAEEKPRPEKRLKMACTSLQKSIKPLIDGQKQTEDSWKLILNSAKLLKDVPKSLQDTLLRHEDVRKNAYGNLENVVLVYNEIVDTFNATRKQRVHENAEWDSEEDRMNATIDTLPAKLTKEKEGVTDLQSDITRLEWELVKEKDTAVDLKSTVANLEAELAEEKNTADDLKSNVAQLEQELAEQKSRDKEKDEEILKNWKPFAKFMNEQFDIPQKTPRPDYLPAMSIIGQAGASSQVDEDEEKVMTDFRRLANRIDSLRRQNGLSGLGDEKWMELFEQAEDTHKRYKGERLGI